MTREIKLRAWSISNKSMSPSGTIKELITGGSEELRDSVYRNWSDLIWLESTGLKDKSGKEIFEGDVVSWNWAGGVLSTGEVYFEKGRFMVRDFYIPSFDEPSDAFGEGLGLLEVTGNIYE